MEQNTPPALAAEQAGIERINQTLTSRTERRILNWLCARTPRAVTSDMLTLLGVVGAVLTFFGFLLSDQSINWLWLAIAGLVLNWLGDSLDGSLARYRGTERPRYGFFLDHMADTFVMALVAIGVGLSPFAHLESGLAVLGAYYLMVILTMTTCVVTGKFRISFAGCGPTEIRLMIIAGTLATIMVQPTGYAILGVMFTAWDFLLLTLAIALVITCLINITATLAKLAAEDPLVP